MHDKDRIKSKLEQILRDPHFQRSRHNVSLLTFLVSETLEGRSVGLKEATIATAVFGKELGFNGSTDNTVRVNAARLRKALSKYYAGSGANNDIAISVPLGGYVPIFSSPAAHDELNANDEIALLETPTDHGGVADQACVRNGWITQTSALLLILILCCGFLLNFTRAAPPFLASIIVVKAARAAGTDGQVRSLADRIGITLSSALERYQIHEIIRSTAREESDDREVLDEVLKRSPREQRVYVIDSLVDMTDNEAIVRWQLLDGHTQELLWSETVRETGEDWAAPERISRQIAAAVASEAGVIEIIERRSMPAKPSPGYECVSSSQAFLVDLSDDRRLTLQNCLIETVGFYPHRAEAWASLAYLYAEESRAAEARGKFARAAEALKDGWKANSHAVRLAPGSLLTTRSTMLLAFQTGKIDLFHEAAENALAELPLGSRDRLLIGQRYFALGEYERAAEIIRSSLANMPNPTPIDRMELFLVHYQKGQDLEALAALRGVGRPRFYLYWAFKAAAAAQLQDQLCARSSVRELSALNPEFKSRLAHDLENRNYRPDFVERVMDGVLKADQIATLGVGGPIGVTDGSIRTNAQEPTC